MTVVTRDKRLPSVPSARNGSTRHTEVLSRPVTSPAVLRGGGAFATSWATVTPPTNGSRPPGSPVLTLHNGWWLKSKTVLCR